MSIFKIEKTRDYTVMSNYHLRDKNLSYKAKGLLSFMLSLPTDWDYSLRGLEAISKESIKAIRNILQELENNKYLIRTRMQDENGRFYYDYSIYEVPYTLHPNYQKGYADEGHTQSGLQINTNIQNIEEQNDKVDKTTFEDYKHNYLTNELIRSRYITCDDSQVFYYDKLFEQLIDDGNDFGDLITIIHYIIPRVLKRDFKDEDGNEIENKFGYFKNSMISNINKLKNPVDNLWDEEEYDYLDDDLER